MSKKLSKKEKKAFSDAMDAVIGVSMAKRQRRPNMGTLLEEVSELILASRGKHNDPTSLELVQIASIAINMLWQDYMGYNDHLYGGNDD
jgi:hypothetical protein